MKNCAGAGKDMSSNRSHLKRNKIKEKEKLTETLRSTAVKRTKIKS